MASSCWGDLKQVQDARFDNHLIGVKKECFYWLTNSTQQRVSEKVKQIRHVEKFIWSKLSAL